MFFKRKAYEDIIPEEVEKTLKDKNKMFIDVREKNEFQEGHIPGAYCIPLGTLNEQLDKVSKEKEIIVICRSGARSAKAAELLASKGYKVKNMVGGMLCWKGKIEG